jgi:hypothetical protein
MADPVHVGLNPDPTFKMADPDPTNRMFIHFIHRMFIHFIHWKYQKFCLNIFFIRNNS